MKIEEGKFYRTVGGEKVGPMRIYHKDWMDCPGDGRLWGPDGKRYSQDQVDDTIIAEWGET